ncbi:MAG: DUF6191 domain-containing protein [Actinomadura sp.]
MAAVIVFTSIPGLVLLLIAFAAIDRMGLAANRRLRLPWHSDGRPMAAPGIDELHAIFYATKRHEMDQRRTSLMLRDEETDGAPPRSEVDLNAGSAIIRQHHRST